MASHAKTASTLPQLLPSGKFTDFCYDCGTRIVASTPGDVDGATCTCPPQRFEYLLELVCSLCSRGVATVRVPTPTAGVLLVRALRCPICGGCAITGDEDQRVLVPAPVNLQAAQIPRRGRPPKALQALRKSA
jgi:hypothetical protein